jgi:hypothetical protein
MSSRPKIISLMTRPWLERYLAALKAHGCLVSRKRGGEFVRVKDGKTVVLAALAKGPRESWIVLCFESDRIHWTTKGRGHATS